MLLTPIWDHLHLVSATHSCLRSPPPGKCYSPTIWDHLHLVSATHSCLRSPPPGKCYSHPPEITSTWSVLLTAAWDHLHLVSATLRSLRSPPLGKCYSQLSEIMTNTRLLFTGNILILKSASISAYSFWTRLQIQYASLHFSSWKDLVVSGSGTTRIYSGNWSSSTNSIFSSTPW